MGFDAPFQGELDAARDTVGVVCGKATQLAAPAAIYATTAPGILGRAPAFMATKIHPAYPATAPHIVGTSGVFDPVIELLHGGGGYFSGVSQSLAELGWPGVTVSEVLSAILKLY